MDAPDVSLELKLEAFFCAACFDSVARLADSGAACLAAARVAAGTAFVVLAPLALVFAAGSTLLFTVVLPGLAMAFVDVDADAVLAAGFRAFATVLANLPATVCSIDGVAGLATVLPLAGATVFADVLLTLFAAVPFVADLVTVAFMAPSLYEPPDMSILSPKTDSRRFQVGLDTIGRHARHLSTHLAKRLPPLLESTSTFFP